MKTIVDLVAQHYKVTPEQIRGVSRIKPMPEARRMIIFFLYVHENTPLKLTGTKVNRNRTFGYKAFPKIVFEIAHYVDIKQNYESIQKQIEMSMEKLKNERRQIEIFLRDNPNAEFVIVYDKQKRLTEINNNLNNA